MSLPRRHLLATLVAGLVLAAPAFAQTPKEQATDLAHELMSPFCPGKLLAECTSSLAGDLRENVATRIAAGETKDAVKADLIRQYGKEILGAPAPEGVGLLAWVLPALLGIVTALGVGWKVARAARAGRAAMSTTLTPAAAGAGDAAALAQLDDELRDLD